MTVAEIEAILGPPQVDRPSSLAIMMGLLIAFFAAGAIYQLAPRRWRLADWLKVVAFGLALIYFLRHEPTPFVGPEASAKWCSEQANPAECNRLVGFGIISPPPSLGAVLFARPDE